MASGLRFAVVVSRFNTLITEQLLSGARDVLLRHGAEEQRIDVAWVPGAFDMPVVTQRMARTGRYDGIVCLGAVIRGGTPHFEYVCSAVTSGLSRVALDCDLPVSFGLLTTDTIDQAIERAGTKAGNKGAEAALACIESVRVLQGLSAVKE